MVFLVVIGVLIDSLGYGVILNESRIEIGLFIRRLENAVVWKNGDMRLMLGDDSVSNQMLKISPTLLDQENILANFECRRSINQRNFWWF